MQLLNDPPIMEVAHIVHRHREMAEVRGLHYHPLHQVGEQQQRLPLLLQLETPTMEVAFIVFPDLLLI